MIDAATTTIGNLLEGYCLAEVARRVGTTREMVFRWRWNNAAENERRIAAGKPPIGSPIWNDAFIPPLAKFLRVDENLLRQIVHRDRANVRRRVRQLRAQRKAAA